MPRLTPSTYLHHHHHLKRLSMQDPRLLSFLSPNDQWALHDYFQLSHDLTDAELLTHRRLVTNAHPSLPHRAGKAYARLVRGERASVPTAVLANGRVITIRPLVRPEPDLRLLADAVRRLAEAELAAPRFRQHRAGEGDDSRKAA